MSHITDLLAQNYSVDTETGCWNWMGRLNNYGYGVVSLPKPVLAHRFFWAMVNGEIPRGDGYHGTVVMHKCDNRKCVNPDHLMLGTQADNVKDMIVKGRKVSGTPSGVKHWNSSIKDQADIDLICATKGQTKALAERFGVDVCTIKRIRTRNAVVTPDAEKYRNKPLTKEAIDHIRSTPPGTRGLGKLYGVGKTTIANIRKGLTHSGP